MLWDQLTLGYLCSDIQVEFSTPLTNVLHQDLHEHAEVFLTQTHLRTRNTHKHPVKDCHLTLNQTVCGTYVQRPEHSLDLDPRDTGVPGRSQVSGDQQLQVDGLQDLDVRLSVLLQDGSGDTETFS